MGKPYWLDLENLSSTFVWAHEAKIEDFQRAVRLAVGSRLISIGSGGSYSAAAFASFLHDQYTGKAAQTVTPLLAARMRGTREAGVYLLSAGGRNPDALGVCRALVDLEPPAMGVLCLRSNSPLGRLCKKYEFIGCTEVDVPSGKDGFVATNSLVAFAVLLNRAYATCTSATCDAKLTLNGLLAGTSTLKEWIRDLRQASRPLWQRDHLLVLYGSGVAQAAVFDIESKFSEAAIGSVQITDFRNFAHGRHHWLDKRQAETAVLAFSTPEDRELADRTLQLLQKWKAVGKLTHGTSYMLMNTVH